MQNKGGFKDLIAWQKAMVLVTAVYKLTAQFPSAEKFGLVSQLRRAAVSIPSNISEGHGRCHKQDFLRFLDIALGSANELETQLIIAERLQFAEPEPIQQALLMTTELQRIIKGLLRGLRTTDRSDVRTGN